MIWENWCQLKAIAPVPVRPNVVAEFVTDCEPLGISKIARELAEISQAHIAAGHADPTAGGVVAAEVNRIANHDAPRSWPTEQKVRFFALPYDLQAFLIERERSRDRAVRNAQNEAAAARQSLAKMENKHEAVA